MTAVPGRVWQLYFFNCKNSKYLICLNGIYYREIYIIKCAIKDIIFIYFHILK